MMIGLGLSICQPSLSSGINPASQSLTGYWKPSFTASPWVGAASAGASGTRNLAEATNPPSASGGDAVFDGINDRLASTPNITSFVSVSAGTIGVLFFPTAASADAGAAFYYSNPSIITDNIDGYLNVEFSDAGFGLGSYNGANFNAVRTAAAAGSWHFGLARWNASVIEVQIDGGDWETLSRTVTLASRTMILGARSGAAPINGKVRELFTMQARVSDATAEGMYGFYKTTYPALGLP